MNSRGSHGESVTFIYLLLIGWTLAVAATDSTSLQLMKDNEDIEGNQENFPFRYPYSNPYGFPCQKDIQDANGGEPYPQQIPYAPQWKRLGSEFVGKRSISASSSQELDQLVEKRRMGSEFLGKKRRMGSEFLGKRTPTDLCNVQFADKSKTEDGSSPPTESAPAGPSETDTLGLHNFHPNLSPDKRRMGSEFLGKRRMGSEFLGKRMGSEFLGKRMGSEFLGKRRMGSEFLGKRRMGSEFLGKRTLVDEGEIEPMEKRRMGSEFLGKRRMGSEFLGKRRMGSEFLGKRRMGSEFLGKRMGSEFLGKRRMGSEFLGKRMGSEFLGKRDDGESTEGGENFGEN